MSVINMPNIRSKEDLIAYLAEGHQLKYLYFWGHTPKDPNAIGKECLSQWYAAGFNLNGVDYPTAEHYMMAEKARLFGDNAALEKILEAKHPAEAKKLGRTVRAYQEELWKKHRFEIVVRGNAAKFSQHEQLSDYLLASGDRVLVEASPMDRIWGIGLAQDAPQINNPATWRGLNLLGFALMVVRTRLSA